MPIKELRTCLQVYLTQKRIKATLRSLNFSAYKFIQWVSHNLKVMGYVLNIEYYFWWRDQSFWLINPLRRMALLHGQYQ